MLSPQNILAIYKMGLLIHCLKVLSALSKKESGTVKEEEAGMMLSRKIQKLSLEVKKNSSSLS